MKKLNKVIYSTSFRGLSLWTYEIRSEYIDLYEFHHLIVEQEDTQVLQVSAYPAVEDDINIKVMKKT